MSLKSATNSWTPSAPARPPIWSKNWATWLPDPDDRQAHGPRGGPSLADALEVEAAKMVRRHPHVFSDTTYENQSEQLKDWDRIKREEKAAADAEGPKGPMTACRAAAASDKGLPHPLQGRPRGLHVARK